ncbi:MAG: hypothetical protein A2X13_14705 [Bacteroidetes bacterium GWC2_33_15]|nr:MAG: hypothetical protein A2X10_06770 [Bacteroidetes bacterium GWA2_33_15]OFX50123.1 MAG: hypothetical protein A2X13_14705 [Bacteroidetes bacterium GWC2_33_15]OFX65276.1 MAG: hypothetical protein A2X15_04280 [Bacteroidetes bacterium GWB2_32_14]OFX70502.1 MAG: hypothetical protein A2X14_04335 [Bacteroidetes bacterium GWD2_33_33]HAN19625.1 hypothetical protein [Bacteroidales bacterium]
MKNYVSKTDDILIKEIKTNGTVLDRIKGYMIYGESRIPLSKKEKDVLERLDAAFTLLVNYNSNEQAIPLLMNRFTISRAQAYRDVRAARDLYGDINKTSKEADRIIALEWTIKTFQMAAKQRPPDLGNMNRAISNYVKLKALDREDPETFREEDLQQHNYYMILQINGESHQLDLNAKGIEKVPKKKMSQIINTLYNEIEDVEAVELLKEDGKQDA